MATDGIPATERRPRALRKGQDGYDRAARRELDDCVSKLTKARITSDEAYWQQGMDYRIIRDKKLYRQDGYSGFGPWVSGHLRRSRTDAFQKMRFTECFNIEEVRVHGRDKLLYVMRYVRLAKGKDAVVAMDGLELLVPKNDKLVKVPALKASAAEAELAVAHQLELARTREANRVPEEHRKLLANFASAVHDPITGGIFARFTARADRLDSQTVVRMDAKLQDLQVVFERMGHVFQRFGKRLRG